MANFFTIEIPEEEYRSVPKHPLYESSDKEDHHVYDVARFLARLYGTIMLIDKSNQEIPSERFVISVNHETQGQSYLVATRNGDPWNLSDNKSDPGYFVKRFQAKFFRSSI